MTPHAKQYWDFKSLNNDLLSNAIWQTNLEMCCKLSSFIKPFVFCASLISSDVIDSPWFPRLLKTSPTDQSRSARIEETWRRKRTLPISSLCACTFLTAIDNLSSISFQTRVELEGSETKTRANTMRKKKKRVSPESFVVVEARNYLRERWASNLISFFSFRRFPCLQFTFDA